MRLFEVITDAYIDDLVTILRNLIGSADSKDQPQELLYPALGQMLKNKGYGDINQQILTSIINKHPELPNLIANFDNEKITLGTRIKDKEQQQQPMDIPLGGKSLDQMAAGGVRDHYRDIGR